MDDRRSNEIEPSPEVRAATAAIEAPKPARRRPAKVTTVWVIAAIGGVLVFAAGLFGLAHPITEHPSTAFFVEGDHGQPSPAAFPAQGGSMCETPLVTFGWFPTCGSVDPNEFDPKVPAFSADESFDVSFIKCHTIAIRVAGRQYTTAEFRWLDPVDASAPWALVVGFVLMVSATFWLAPHRALVAAPVVVLPVTVFVAAILGWGSVCL